MINFASIDCDMMDGYPLLLCPRCIALISCNRM